MDYLIRVISRIILYRNCHDVTQVSAENSTQNVNFDTQFHN